MAARARVLHSGGEEEDDGKNGFVREPGIAQSVHWFRDQDAGLTEDLMASLISSELQVPVRHCGRAPNLSLYTRNRL